MSSRSYQELQLAAKPFAPTLANLYQALHELEFWNDWIAHVPIYIRFIDDIFGTSEGVFPLRQLETNIQ